MYLYTTITLKINIYGFSQTYRWQENPWTLLQMRPSTSLLSSNPCMYATWINRAGRQIAATWAAAVERPCPRKCRSCCRHYSVRTGLRDMSWGWIFLHLTRQPPSKLWQTSPTSGTAALVAVPLESAARTPLPPQQPSCFVLATTQHYSAVPITVAKCRNT